MLPAEHPESVAVPEMTVVVEPFRELRATLEPGRRRGWLGARFRTAVQNRGNAPMDVVLSGRQPGEELRLAFTPERRRLEPGESAEAGLKVRARKLIWFGAPAAWPFEVVVAEPEAEGAGVEDVRTGRPEPLQGEFAQLPLFPKWLLILLAAVLALLLAWFALVRPAVRSTAEEAGAKAAQEESRQPRQGGGAASGAAADGGQEKPGGQGARPARTGPAAARAVPVRPAVRAGAAPVRTPSRPPRPSTSRRARGPGRPAPMWSRKARISVSRTSSWPISRATRDC